MNLTKFKKNTDYETGAELFGCIPSIDKISPALRDKLYTYVNMSLQYPQYEAFIAHLFVPRNGIFNGLGPALTFARELTGKPDMGKDELTEFFFILHGNASDLKAEYTALKMPNPPQFKIENGMIKQVYPFPSFTCESCGKDVVEDPKYPGICLECYNPDGTERRPSWEE
jgi:hypothetical protein